MLLIRIWSKEAGLVYDLVRDGLSGEQPVEVPQIEFSVSVMAEQMVFGF